MIKSLNMSRTINCGALLGLASLCMGCGLASNSQQSAATITPPAQGQVSVFLEDAPADNVVTLNIAVTDAALFDSGGKRYPLLVFSRSFELRQLRLAPTLAISSVNVAPATFASMEVGLSTPRLTLVAADGTLQQLTETTTPSVSLANPTVTVPAAFTLANNQAEGIILDFNIQNSLSVDANGNYLITPVLKSAIAGTSGPSELSMTLGKVAAVQTAANTMDVQILSIGDTIHAKIDGTTAFDPAIGQLSSLHAGSMIELEAKFQPDGSYLVKYVNPGAPDPTLRYQGVLMDTGQSGTNPTAQIVTR